MDGFPGVQTRLCASPLSGLGFCPRACWCCSSVSSAGPQDRSSLARERILGQSR